MDFTHSLVSTYPQAVLFLFHLFVFVRIIMTANLYLQFLLYNNFVRLCYNIFKQRSRLLKFLIFLRIYTHINKVPRTRRVFSDDISQTA